MIEKHGRRFASMAEVRRFEIAKEEKEHYQLRLDDGQITHFATLKELEVTIILGNFQERIEKISFNGPSGERIRLVYDPFHRTFNFTYWLNDSYHEIGEDP